jgi:hypothetical protein
MTKCHLLIFLGLMSSFIVNTNVTAGDANKFTFDTSNDQHWKKMFKSQNSSPFRPSKIDQLKGSPHDSHSYRCQPVSSENKDSNLGGAIALLGAVATVGKLGWDWWCAGEKVLDVAQDAINTKKRQQDLQEKELQQKARDTQARNEANDLNRELSEEAHEAQAAIATMSLTQIHLMAVAEEEANSTSRFFRDKYVAELAKTAKKPHVI